VVEAFARDRHLEFVAHREVGQRQPTGRMRLAEEDFLLLPMLGTPGAHAPLQGAKHPVTEHVAVSALQFLEQGSALQIRLALEQRHQLRVPHRGQRIGPRSPRPRPELRRQPVGQLDASRRAHADPHPRRRNLLRRLPSRFLVFAHLLVRDLLAGHSASPNLLRQKSTVNLASGPSRRQFQPAKIVVADRSG